MPGFTWRLTALDEPPSKSSLKLSFRDLLVYGRARRCRGLHCRLLRFRHLLTQIYAMGIVGPDNVNNCKKEPCEHGTCDGVAIKDHVDEIGQQCRNESQCGKNDNIEPIDGSPID